MPSRDELLKLWGVEAPAEKTVQSRAAARRATTRLQTKAYVEMTPDERVKWRSDLMAQRRDLQRIATPLERTLEAMQVPGRAVRGALVATAKGQNPLIGAREGVRTRLSGADIIPDKMLGLPEDLAGMVNLYGGLAIDFATDPLMPLTAGGLTKAGTLAKAATTEARLAEVGRDAARLADAQAGLQRTGEFMEGLGNQARAGYRTMVGAYVPGLGNVPVLPRGMQGVLGDIAQAVGTGARRTIGPAFMTFPELTGIQRDVLRMRFNQVRGAPRLADLESMREVRPVMDRIKAKADELGLQDADVRKSLMDYVEWGGDRNVPGVQLEPIHPELQPMADELLAVRRNLMDRNLRAMQAEGVPVEEFATQVGGGDVSPLEYVPHIPEEATTRAIAEAGTRTGGSRRIITENIPALKHRQFVFPEGHPLEGTPLSVNEANRVAAEVDAMGKGSLDISGYKPVVRFFGDDPGVAIAYGNRAAAKSVESARMLNDYARVFGVTPKDAAQRTALLKQGYRVVRNDLTGVGDKVLFPPHIAKALNRVTDPGITFTGWMKKAVDAYDSGLRTWKGITLPIFAAYHSRNELDDVFRAVAYGQLNPRELGESFRLMADKNATMVVKGTRYTGQELYEKSIYHGATGTGLVGEIGGEISPISGLASRNPVDAFNESALMRGAWKVGETRENWTRFAMFLDRLKKGDSFEAAAAWSNKFLFDYGDMPAWATSGGKRAFPFLSYTWHNVPLQYEMLAKRPGVASAVQKVREAAARASGSEDLGLGPDEKLPGFLASSLPVRAGGTDQQPIFWPLRGYLGMADLNAPFEPVDRLKALLSPAIQIPAEMISGQDMYRGTSLEGPDKNFLGFPINQRFVEPILGSLRPLTELDRLNPGSVFGTQERGPAWNPDLKRERGDVPWEMRLAAMLIGRPYSVDRDRMEQQTRTAYEIERGKIKAQLRRAETKAKEKYWRDRLEKLEAEPWRAFKK